MTQRQVASAVTLGYGHSVSSPNLALLPLIHFVHETSLGDQSRGGSKCIQRTFVV